MFVHLALCHFVTCVRFTLKRQFYSHCQALFNGRVRLLDRHVPCGLSLTATRVPIGGRSSQTSVMLSIASTAAWFGAPRRGAHETVIAHFGVDPNIDLTKLNDLQIHVWPSPQECCVVFNAAERAYFLRRRPILNESVSARTVSKLFARLYRHGCKDQARLLGWARQRKAFAHVGTQNEYPRCASSLL